jgi:hypothetical protein
MMSSIRSARVGALASGVVVLVCMALCACALGEVGVPAGTVQQVAADARFLQYAPAPPTPGIVCLVDSGVDPSPDTTPILAGSYALSPGTNTEDELAVLNPPLPGGHPDGHGTYMAMLAELLESAASIGWSAERLGKEVLAAHSRKGQVTPAGRFSAFAGHLTELAETARVGEAA